MDGRISRRQTAHTRRQVQTRRRADRRTAYVPKSSFMSKICVSAFIVLSVFISGKIDAPFLNGLNENVKMLITKNTSVDDVKDTYYYALNMLDSAREHALRINGEEPPNPQTDNTQTEDIKKAQKEQETEAVVSGEYDDGIIIDEDLLNEINDEDDIYKSLQKK